MTFQEELANNIRDARLRNNLRQADLAQKIGVTQSTLCHYEHARRMPTVKIVSIMSNVLDVSLDELVPQAEYEEATDINQTSIYDLIG